MSSGFSVRRYQPSDAARVWEVHEEAMRDADAYLDPESLPGDQTLDADLRAVEETYLDGSGEFLVGERDGRVVATGGLRSVEADADGDSPWTDVGDRTFEVTRMRVVPDHQGNGYGTQILTELEARARERDAETLVLDTLARLSAARRLYERHGYRQTDTRTRGEWKRLFYRKSLE
jgi:GNAT superfamily N-acetyltransferase